MGGGEGRGRSYCCSAEEPEGVERSRISLAAGRAEGAQALAAGGGAPATAPAPAPLGRRGLGLQWVLYGLEGLGGRLESA